MVNFLDSMQSRLDFETVAEYHRMPIEKVFGPLVPLEPMEAHSLYAGWFDLEAVQRIALRRLSGAE